MPTCNEGEHEVNNKLCTNPTVTVFCLPERYPPNYGTDIMIEMLFSCLTMPSIAGDAILRSYCEM